MCVVRHCTEKSCGCDRNHCHTYITIQRLWENDNTYNERVSHITNEYVEKLLAVYVGVCELAADVWS